MPPHVPRKRLREESLVEPSPKRQQVAKGQPNPRVPSARRKPTLYDDLDATTTPSSSKVGRSAIDVVSDSDETSALSDLSDGDFEDVPVANAQKAEELSDNDDNDDIEFEDVPAPRTTLAKAATTSQDLQLTLDAGFGTAMNDPYGDKKGPTKREKKIRVVTHFIHVQYLLWHNALRNSWIGDLEVQAIMMSHVPPRLWEEVERWRRASGLDAKPQRPPPKLTRPAKKTRDRGKGKKVEDDSRDWGPAAERMEEGAADMSHGDPLFRLMKSLVAWWRQRFRITAPGIRKWGYMHPERVGRLRKAWETEGHDQDRFGERINDLEGFRKCAQECTGSRDIGSQLFTALIRALGLEARMVASLQPLGFGWTKLEEAHPEKEKNAPSVTNSNDTKSGKGKTKGKTNKAAKEVLAEKGAKQTPRSTTSSRISSTRRASQKDAVIEMDDSDAELGLEHPDSDDESVVELEVTPRKSTVVSKKFDQDLDFPHYWTEVLSPVTKKYLPVDPIVKNVIGTNRDLIESLEPRGGKAEKAKQVMAYVVGFSSDGTAKDVTVRYLRKQLWPGRTKGSRMSPEKVPIYNRHGKVKRYDQFDWFKSAMKGFAKGGQKHPLTEEDEVEDSTDLTPAQPEKKEVKEGSETLAYYKQSKEFCLERHLKREEALLPTAVPVKTFKNKGKGVDVSDEPVFSRKDVVNVKSAETWHKQGRAPKPGERPLKRVPYRAATTNRRREIAEAEAVSGEKVLQGLYSFDQTEWIIPPPIKDGVIPKNEYGNIDLFAEHMCPEGAAHVPFRGAVKVCKRLKIDYAEAVVDFEFGNRMAVPVIQGVVIAEEYHDQVMEEIRKDEAERARKEDEKRRKEALRVWSKFLKGLRIVERIRQDYGHVDDSVPVFQKGTAKAIKDTHEEEEGEETHRVDAEAMQMRDEEMAGGFFPEGHEEEEVEQPKRFTSGFFPVVDEGDDDQDMDGDLVVDHGRDEKPDTSDHADGTANAEESSPVSEHLPAPVKAKPRPKKKAVMRRSTRRRQRPVADSEDEDDDDFLASDDDY
ncbi:Rad4 transglutaminase-like domain-containing protein [Colletotrichum graminicola]|uniref:Rad4 transglutaminase-like domain-containing protein n=1 Tax=Colletotrichum graminicola (strain M1.001 / M2 / FGSC 10212) TaxID=645133 RepID=E3QV21_COLGM|nr:Rad4 transglutaminase-like domain-containing protein [Colletotrichum graminicola M1.001]EFQ34711.1 Rad4 transglutaminase-like domain-containing protein [Colletotrichum graminicola M1.001]WDK16934.1 Rad4 transglutaminase-like domain-containing protein [Colletotrichum graminicola]